jgi:hypothetical protein
VRAEEERERASLPHASATQANLSPISFPKHARSQVKGGHSSGEIGFIQAGDWLAVDSKLDSQREFYTCWTIVAKYKQCLKFLVENLILRRFERRRFDLY